MNLDTIVGHVGGRCKGEDEEQRDWRETPATSSQVRAKIEGQFEEVFAFLERKNDRRSFDDVERGLIPLLFGLGRLFLAFYLASREERSKDEVAKWARRGYRPREPKQRKYLNTFFGRVVFWRTYVRKPGGTGLHPLDRALGLTADGFTLLVMSMGARLCTLMPYEQVTAVCLYFLAWSPSKTTIEKSVLGFGRYTQEWFESAPAPEGDGEVLVIQIDSKATPTATEQELERRRGKRRPEERAPSPRHRGRAKRARRGSKRRRKKGDKSKNGKAATIVVMYTLKHGRDRNGKAVLLGPINKRVYASYAPKRHAFAFARREADKRGFTFGSNKKIQLVTDGDEDLERYAKEFFPGVEHTLDIMHVLEYVWEAGRFFQTEGSKELADWVKVQERLLYRNRAAAVVENIAKLHASVSQSHRKRLDDICQYLTKRLHLMRYGRLRREDLEIASGMVEGAVKHVIGKRFDNGSMRWIRERAEPLLQLRCIEINGQWSQFIAFVQRRLQRAADRDADSVRLLTNEPVALPTFGVSADNEAA